MNAHSRTLRHRIVIRILVITLFGFFPMQMALAQRIDFLYSHGYNLKGSSMDSLHDELSDLLSPAPKSEAPSLPYTYMPDHAGPGSGGDDDRENDADSDITSQAILQRTVTDTDSITRQARMLDEPLTKLTKLEGNDGVILVGQSQGGIRAREYLQNVSLKDGLGAGRDKIVGLATISSPNDGSNLISHGVPYLRGELQTLNTLSTIALPPIYLGVRDEINYFVDGLVDEFGLDQPGVQDMALDSPLLKRINNMEYETCEWASRKETRYFLWIFPYTYTIWYQECLTVQPEGFEPVPDDVATMSIITANNDTDKLIADFTGSGNFGPNRIALGAFVTILAGVAWGFAFFPWLIPVAIALTALATFIFNLPFMHQSVVGGQAHDGLFTEETQDMYRRDANGEVIPEFDIGGYFKETRRIPEAFHDFENIDNGALSDYAPVTAGYLRELREQITIPSVGTTP